MENEDITRPTFAQRDAQLLERIPVAIALTLAWLPCQNCHTAKPTLFCFMNPKRFLPLVQPGFMMVQASLLGPQTPNSRLEYGKNWSTLDFQY